MTTSVRPGMLLAGCLLVPSLGGAVAWACCPAGPPGKPVVNADQTVILLWDRATKIEHFIRQASFKSEAEDFGFLVPTPAEPLLAESGNEAFPYLLKLTEPETRRLPRPSSISCGCSTQVRSKVAAGEDVTVLSERRVAGFHAHVLQARSAGALVGWLKDHGYSFSLEVKAWAEPYVRAGWKITALRVAKDADHKDDRAVHTAALRLSFHTDTPLFPYREPDPKDAAAVLGASHRLLRIYFIADARYRGEFTKDSAWTGRVAWANQVGAADRQKLLAALRMPETTGPKQWWLTEFEDDWPYRVAPADVSFTRDPDQGTIRRQPLIEYVAAPWPTDLTFYAIAAALVVPPLVRRCRARRESAGQE